MCGRATSIAEAALRPRAATPDALREAAAHLRDGRLVAFPTETVYGLGADACSAEAVARIYAAKGRPAYNPLIVHVARVADVSRWAVLPPHAEPVARYFWPGPLTLVLPLRAGAPLAPAVTAGLDTVAVRVPSHPVARALLDAFEGPLAAPSANPSGQLSPTLANHVADGLADADALAMVLDAGASAVGLESTILDATGPDFTVLRPGTLLPELEALLGPLPHGGDEGRPTSPGQLARHYSPRIPVRLEARDCRPDEAWLGFGPTPAPEAFAQLNLSERGDLAEAASNLFAALHTLEVSGASAIAVAPIPDQAEGVAINDRLRRAAGSQAR